MALVPSWEVTLLRRPEGSARARVMGRLRFRSPDAARARRAARDALAARSGSEAGWSLGVLRSLTPNAPGTYPYVVTFAAWEAREEGFVRRDVHARRVWATDATSARRVAAEQVQAMPGYLAAWRVREVAQRGPACDERAEGAVSRRPRRATLRRGPVRAG